MAKFRKKNSQSDKFCKKEQICTKGKYFQNVNIVKNINRPNGNKLQKPEKFQIMVDLTLFISVMDDNFNSSWTISARR